MAQRPGGGAGARPRGEKKYRIEDALHAARAALEEGIVTGGGQALLRIKRELEKNDGVLKDISKGDAYAAGIKAVLEACVAPLRRIVTNAGQSPDVVISKCLDLTVNDWGWDVAKANMVNLRKEGVIDPVKVTRCALQNAVSVAGIFLQLEAVVHEPTEK
jgi:chaperonin GroEL